MMGKYTRRQRRILIMAVIKAKQGLVSFVSYLSSLSEEEQEFLKEKFNINAEDESRRYGFI